MTSRHFFVGGGIAALAGAALLIRNHGVSGADIALFDAGETPGGSLDGAAHPQGGYVVRGARMFEQNYVCTKQLMSAIPAPSGDGTLLGDFEAFNRAHPTPYVCVRIGPGGTTDPLGFQVPRGAGGTLARMLLRGEDRLAGLRICDLFDRAFFDSRLWVTMSTAFAFQPWHSAQEFRRYLRRFLHFSQSIRHHDGVLSTRFNQADALVRPLVDWLSAQGVRFHRDCAVRGATFTRDAEARRVSALDLGDKTQPVTTSDRVYFTIGSMTDGARVGPLNGPPPADPSPMPALALWRALAAAAPGFGRPEAFAPDGPRTGWQSFTLTLPHGALGDYLARRRPPNAPATVLYALTGTPWRMALVPFVQPHFPDQPDGTEVIWGYGLRPDRAAAATGLSMAEAGRDAILAEIAHHFDMSGETAARLFDGATLVNCHMPLVTSQFMPRRPGDRAQTRPEGAANYACMGQFTEIALDTVFTVEYSVRSAWAAVAALNGGPPPPPVVRSDHDPRVLAHMLGNLARASG